MDSGSRARPLTRLRAARTKRLLAAAQQGRDAAQPPSRKKRANNRTVDAAQTPKTPTPEIHGWRYNFDSKDISGEVHNYPGQTNPVPITTSVIVRAEGAFAHTRSGSRYKLVEADRNFAWAMRVRGLWTASETSLSSLLHPGRAAATQSVADHSTNNSGSKTAVTPPEHNTRPTHARDKQPRWDSSGQLTAAVLANATRDPDAIFGDHDYLSSPTSDSVGLCRCKQIPCSCGNPRAEPLLPPSV